LNEEIARLHEEVRVGLAERDRRQYNAKAALERAETMLTNLGQDPAALSDGVASLIELVAPASGTIIELAVVNVGQIVDAGTLLARIVPSDAILDLHIDIPNNQIGELEPGDELRFKVDAFPYVDHGVLIGTVERLSPSANTDELGAFVAEGRLEKDFFKIRGQAKRLLPGMRGTVEVKVGTERMITRFFAPLRSLFEPDPAHS